MSLAMQRAATAALSVIIVSFAADQVSARGGEWARNYVRQREAAMVERVLGRQAADRMRIAPRIIGGDVAPPGRRLHQAGLLFASEPDNKFAQYCGASIIGAKFVLTAAHCTDFLGRRDIHVLTGTQSLSSGGTRHQVERLKIHPRWDPVTFDYDVALIQLKTPVTGISVEKFARMVSDIDEERLLAPEHGKALVTGWGDTKPGAGERYPTELHQVMVRMVSRPNCNDANSYDGAITRRMTCAGYDNGGRDSCQGDSGGPLVVRDALGKMRAQVGIVSWGTGCALPDLFGVYSRVAVLNRWVNDVIAGLTP
jgi:secreted trypsin-like serine protease